VDNVGKVNDVDNMVNPETSSGQGYGTLGEWMVLGVAFIGAFFREYFFAANATLGRSCDLNGANGDFAHLANVPKTGAAFLFTFKNNIQSCLKPSNFSCYRL
jgi:hypothetical protein